MNTLINRCTDPVILKPNLRRRGGIFLDRDGTLIEEKHYLSKITDIKILPGVAAGLQKLSFTGLPLYIFTNQAGVAHGYLDESDLTLIHHYLINLFKRNKIFFSGLLYCPHHPKAEIPEFKLDCDCRKPKAGLLLKAAQLENIDLKKSYVIGDKLIDIQAGKKVGSKTILVLTGYGKTERTQITEEKKPNLIAAHFGQAIHWILKDWSLCERMTVQERSNII